MHQDVHVEIRQSYVHATPFPTCGQPCHRLRSSRMRAMMRTTTEDEDHHKLLAAPVMTSVTYRPCQLPWSLTHARCVSWYHNHLVHASHLCPAVMSVSTSCVKITQSTNKAVAILFAAWPSQWCCVCGKCTCL